MHVRTGKLCLPMASVGNPRPNPLPAREKTHVRDAPIKHSSSRASHTCHRQLADGANSARRCRSRKECQIGDNRQPNCRVVPGSVTCSAGKTRIGDRNTPLRKRQNVETSKRQNLGGGRSLTLAVLFGFFLRPAKRGSRNGEPSIVSAGPTLSLSREALRHRRSPNRRRP